MQSRILQLQSKCRRRCLLSRVAPSPAPALITPELQPQPDSIADIMARLAMHQAGSMQCTSRAFVKTTAHMRWQECSLSF